MATIAFETQGSRGCHGGKNGPPAQTTGVNTSNFIGYSQNRTLAVTPAIASIIKVPVGEYEHTGETSTGDWIYSPANRNV